VETVTAYDGWPALGEVMERTGLSERSVYRAVTHGKLRSAQRPLPGRKPLPVYHPDDVRDIEQSMMNGRTHVLPQVTESRQNAAGLPPAVFWEALVTALKTNPAILPPAAAESELPPLAELRQRIVVTRAEAKRFGFTHAILRTAVTEGKLERLPGGRFKMRELEAL
jgi:hypothetical protein